MTPQSGVTDLTSSPQVTEAVVASVDEMALGSMKMTKVGERRIVVIRTATGFHALDNACPHQGYGLATGALDAELLTCQWHNWKFRVSDGVCVIGEEDVACHQVHLVGNDVIVAVTEPTTGQRLDQLWPSLLRGVERNYQGQMARDTARLLDVGATPESIIAIGLGHSLPRNEWGIGHEMAVAADLLHLSDRYEGLDKTLPLAHALSGLAEESRDRLPHALIPYTETPAHQQSFVDAIEREDEAGAVNTLRTLLRTTPYPDAIAHAQRWFVDAVSRHHYDYGHGAIYAQKAFVLTRRLPDLAELVLTELTRSLVYGTREDTLPYMRKANRSIEAVDVVALADAPSYRTTGWIDQDHALVSTLLDAEHAPIEALVTAVHDGAGVEGLLNTVSLAAAYRLLRFDLALERDHRVDFGWLDITHVLTYTNAARWAWAGDPGPSAARLALLTSFLAFDSGRGERHHGIHRTELPTAREGNLFEAIIEQRPADAVAHALAGAPDAVADQLEAAGLEDLGGSFIVMAHLVKMAVAARHEAVATGSPLPLAATARFMASPRTERFVTRNVREAIDFVRTGQPGTR